jgi:plasmid stabilization system protein ParE
VRVEVTERAQREVNRLGRWWLENRDKAPELFEDELSAAYFRIATDPNAGKLYTVSCGRRILRVLTGKTKNHVYYHQHSPGIIRVVSVWGAYPTVVRSCSRHAFPHSKRPSAVALSHLAPFGFRRESGRQAYRRPPS